MSNPDSVPATQGFPARYVTMSGIETDDNCLNLSQAGFAKWKNLLSGLFIDRANNFTPRAFIINQPPLTDPFFGYGILSGSLFPQGWTETLDFWELSMDLILMGWESDGVHSAVSVVAAGGTARYRFFGQAPNLPNDPDKLFEVLSPCISKGLDEVVRKFVRDPRFRYMPWQSIVQTVENNLVGIKGSQIDNIKAGDLFEVMRPIPGVVGGPVYDGVATIQALNVPASASLLTECTYYGKNQPPALVGDAVSIYDINNACYYE